MPVTIKPSPKLVGCNKDHVVHSAEELLRVTSQAWAPLFPRLNFVTRKMDEPESRRIIQSSFGDLNRRSSLIPYGNGMVKGIIRSFQQDLHLILRPDDVWLSILTQFNFFINANSELLRAHFVTHKAKKNLMIDISPYPVWSMNMGKVAQEMTRLIQENLVDVELRDWIIPNFSTTTDEDKSVAAIVMMGTLKSYFNYTVRGGCGFPSVTLLGERSDWEEILCKVENLPKYGNEATEWSRLLTPVIKHMISSFDQPNSERVKHFWLRACHSAGQDGSGKTDSLSGWITAFCFWSEDGTRVEDYTQDYLNQELFPVVDRKRLILDEVAYPMINPKSIPTGVVSVSVDVQDLSTGLEHKTTMVAGSVGMTATAVGLRKDQVQPRSGWWMLEDSVGPIGGKPTAGMLEK